MADNLRDKLVDQMSDFRQLRFGKGGCPDFKQNPMFVYYEFMGEEDSFPTLSMLRAQYHYGGRTR